MENGTDIAMKGQLAGICRAFGVTSLYAFGSRSDEALARISGREIEAGAPRRDLDAAVQPARGVTLSAVERVRLMALLEDLFDVPRVDLVILSEADSFLAAEVVRGELLYCEDEDQQAEEELYYLGRAGDLSGLERARLEGILKGELRR